MSGKSRRWQERPPGSRAHGSIMPARVRAVLGPTNTGKTHYALERLLAHESGIIAFPLRLLARENYERMAALKGYRAVALITGEEKIIPPGARWIACTTEAMPLDRHAEFLAIDEIQLCADPDRGHIFTDRLLHARGTVETLFLGAETIRPLLQRLIPQVEIETRPRLSHLTGTGHTKLSRLPPRSAIVAFSAAEVYAIAEAIRQRRGGCALVMGRLSPRTRNAQVQLYQNKDVDYLVATDAIGMGLNMEVNHVALASTTKFDGRALRPLHTQEIAQIAGRAGRGARDGTFGTTGEARPLSETATQAIENHRFDPLQRLSWRNSALDFSAPDTLLAALHQPPPRAGLTAGRPANDLLTLELLAQERDIRDATHGEARTRLLWDVCQIPDFRKLGDDSHTRLCHRLFFHLLGEGVIPSSWIDGHIAAFSRPEGDIDTLMQRLAGVRVAAYVAARTGWVTDSLHWQERARAAEDLLSDALHERLTARFVDRRATSILRRLDSDGDRTLLSAVTRDGEVIVEGHAVGRVEGFTLLPGIAESGPEQRLMLRAGRRALLQEIPRRVKALVEADDGELSLDIESGLIKWRGASLARLVKGHSVLQPGIQMLHAEFHDSSQRDIVRARLATFIAARIRRELASLFTAAAAASLPATRGLVHRLIEYGGIAPAEPSDHRMEGAARRQLRHLGIVVGETRLFHPALIRPGAMSLRALLLSVWHGQRLPAFPPAQRTAVSCAEVAAGAPGQTLPEGGLQRLDAIGWCTAGRYLLRVDVAERLRHDAARLTRNGACQPNADLLSRLNIPRSEIPGVLTGLGLRVALPQPMRPGQYGPDSPLILLSRRAERRPKASKRLMRPNTRTREADAGPFAALRALLASAE